MAQDIISTLAWSVFGLIFVVVGLYTLNRGRKEWAQSERIADTATTPIRDLQPGAVEVKGTAHLAENATVMESPITKTDALATYVAVEEWESSGQGGGSWKTMHEEEIAVSMIVDDGTGEVRVELPAASGLNVEQTQTKVEAGDEPPKQITEYIENEANIDAATRHDIGPLSIGERRRYSEGVIEPGEEVYALGTAREEQAGWGERKYVIAEPTAAGDFILSDKSEEDLIQEGKQGGLVPLAFGGVLIIVGTLVLLYSWLWI